jgi:hypothetical protein
MYLITFTHSDGIFASANENPIFCPLWVKFIMVVIAFVQGNEQILNLLLSSVADSKFTISVSNIKFTIVYPRG